MATKPKSKKEPGFAHYARAIQDDIAAVSTMMQAGFGSIREHMATKDDIAKLATREELREVRDDVKRITDMMVSKADLENVIRDEFATSDHAKRIEDLRQRMEHVEKKLGIKSTHQAA